MERGQNRDTESQPSLVLRADCPVGVMRKTSAQEMRTVNVIQQIRIIKDDSKVSDTDSGWSAVESCSSCSNLIDAQTTKLKSGSASTNMIDIAVRNEEDQPDYVDIDKADDEEERDVDTVPPLVTIMPRLPSSEHIRTVQPPAISSSAELASKFRAQSISERVLKRRNSENALQQVMQVAQSRKETLAKLINEHQKLVKEVEKWSSVASVRASRGEPINGFEQPIEHSQLPPSYSGISSR